MKILFYADAHIRSHGSFLPYNRIAENGLTKELNNIIKGFTFVADKIKEINPIAVFNLGDLYQNTEILDVLTITASAKCLDKVYNTCRKLDIPHYYVLGNHDVYSENPLITNVANLRGYFDNIFFENTYFNLPTTDFTIGVVPYRSEVGHVYSSLCDAQESSDLIVTHLDFANGLYENNHKSTSLLNPHLSRPCISGDLHIPNSVGSVSYVGSLVQHRFSRYDLDKVGGILIYDIESGEIERIPNTYSKHYVKVLDLDKGLKLDPNRAILQIYSELEKNHIEEHFKDFEYDFYKTIKPVVETEYVNEVTFNPVLMLQDYISKNNPNANEIANRLLKEFA